MSTGWVPACGEDELLLALVRVRRAMLVNAPLADPGTFPLLHHIAAHGPARQTQLADAMGLDASTVSRHVRALVTAGWVDASRDPDDGRATVLSATDHGRAQLEDRLQQHRATLTLATDDFTTEERADLVRLLDKLAAGLGARKESA